MKFSTSITIAIILQILCLTGYSLILEKGDINSIGLILVILILPIIAIGLINAIILKFAGNRKKFIEKRIWSLLPVVMMILLSIPNKYFLDGNLSYIGLIGIPAIGITNTIWNVEIGYSNCS